MCMNRLNVTPTIVFDMRERVSTVCSPLQLLQDLQVFHFVLRGWLYQIYKDSFDLCSVVSSQLNHARGRWILLPLPGGGQGPSPDKMERNVFVLSKDETCVSLIPSD